MMTSNDQPTQPLTDAELVRILELMEQQPKLYSYMEKKLLSTINADRAEVDRLRAALTALGRNERVAANRSLELQEENDRLRLETAQMESGAQIAMNAGVTALQEVKRLEAMIAAVVAIHKPTGINSWGHRTCIECDTPGYYQEWPCPTLVALGFEEQ